MGAMAMPRNSKKGAASATSTLGTSGEVTVVSITNPLRAGVEKTQ